MLADHGITDGRIISTEGRLTDHPTACDKTVNLSEACTPASTHYCYHCSHECRHAVQHATAPIPCVSFDP
jgi:Zn-dependent membrane protease YugP